MGALAYYDSSSEKPFFVDLKLAKELGFLAAHLYSRICKWTATNQEKGKCFYEGHFWMFQSHKGWEEQLNYAFEERSIRTALDNLVKLGMITKGQFGKGSRTCSYRPLFTADQAKAPPKPRKSSSDEIVRPSDEIVSSIERDIKNPQELVSKNNAHEAENSQTSEKPTQPKTRTVFSRGELLEEAFKNQHSHGLTITDIFALTTAYIAFCGDSANMSIPGYLRKLAYFGQKERNRVEIAEAMAEQHEVKLQLIDTYTTLKEQRLADLETISMSNDLYGTQPRKPYQAAANF